MTSSHLFAQRVLCWFEHNGRKDLPWQQATTPYRVWISEIMLQQTRADTVSPYYQRFVQRFPDVSALADAQIDEVLHLWSGMGYYARARNLHRAAVIIRDEYDGIFPQTFDAVCTLPGIGRSTAGAILSLGLGQRCVILDGNVKRVLARHAGIDGWPGKPSVAKQLWHQAEQYTPTESCAAYNQAMMDLGATLCVKIHPSCDRCPVQGDCYAYAKQLQTMLPTAKPTVLPIRQTVMLLLRDNAECWLLQRRKVQGIWGGLWSFPEFATTEQALGWCIAEFGAPNEVETLEPLQHGFSHFRLRIKPICVRYRTPVFRVMECDDWVWYKPGATAIGVAAPISKLLEKIEKRGIQHGSYGTLRQTG